MACRFTEVVFDANDPVSLAAFWAEVLGWEVKPDPDGTVELVGPEPGMPSLVFVEVSEPKTVKNRVHIDVNPVGCDQHEEVQRLIALGARPADVGQGEQSWVVLADPEGNELCVLRRRLD